MSVIEIVVGLVVSLLGIAFILVCLSIPFYLLYTKPMIGLLCLLTIFIVSLFMYIEPKITILDIASEPVRKPKSHKGKMSGFGALPLGGTALLATVGERYLTYGGLLLILVLSLSISYFLLRYRVAKLRNRRLPRYPATANFLSVPRKLYEGDSSMVVVSLARWVDFAPHSATRPLFLINGYGDKRPLGIEIEHGFQPKYLEVELLAAGFDVEGEKRQRNEVLPAPMIYNWNIRAPASGDFEIGLVFRAEDASEQTRQVGTITERVKVVKIDHLRSRHLWLLSGIFGAIIATLTVLIELGVIGFK